MAILLLGCMICLSVSCADTFWAWHNVLLNFTIEAPSHEQFSWLLTLFSLDTLLCSFFSCSCMLVCALSECFPNILFILTLICYTLLQQKQDAYVLWKGGCSVFSFWHRIVLPYLTALLIFQSRKNPYSIENSFPNAFYEAYFSYSSKNRRLPQIPVCWKLFAKQFS